MQDVLPPVTRQELRQHDRHHLIVAAGLDLVDVIEQRAQQRAIRRGQHHQRHPEPPPGPLLLDPGRPRRVRLDVDATHGRVRRGQGDGVGQRAHDAAMDVAHEHQDRVLKLRRSLEVLQRQAGRDRLVVTPHGQEGRH